MRLSPEMTFHEVVLRRVELSLAAAVSPYVLREARPEVTMDHVAQRLVARLDSHVYGQSETATHTIVEEPVFLSWRHQLVSSLPEGFRRRFLTYFWGLEGQQLAKRTTHTVTADARAVFPKAEVQMPREYGDVVRLAAIDSYASYGEIR